MSVNSADTFFPGKQNNFNSLSEAPISSKTETNPANMDSAIDNNDPNECNSNQNESSCNKNSSNQEHSAQKGSIHELKERVDNGESNKNDTNIDSSCNNNDSSVIEQKDDSSTFSTAFTISFGDDDSASKKLGIKDSIRKFAPPKPHTIERPRQSKGDQCQDNSLASIESAPAGLSKHFVRKGCSNSSRSSSRRSNSSRHSNISESAAFLIDKMLNFKQDEVVSEEKQDKSLRRNKSPSNSSHGKKGSPGIRNRMAHSSDDILDSEIDFPEDKSDNGTYIVGADPESDAARKKIDELFGVVKAAEASVIADSARVQRTIYKVADSKYINTSRSSRASDKKSENGRNSSRSSSSSRNENSVTTTRQHQQKTSSRHSRNSSCDRTPRPHHQDHTNRPKRSISQSSRHSSNKEYSDGDTRSSRSSLHNETERTIGHDNPLSNLPSMKFNRAFALRRARLGLGEPTRGPVNQSNYNQDTEPAQTNNVLSSSQRRHQINTSTYKAANQSSSSGSANFCRDDGGRFSLRMKNSVIPNRLNSAHILASTSSSNKSPQHSNTLLDGYINKVSGLSKTTGVYTNVLPSQQEQAHSPRNLPKPSAGFSSNSLTYQSGDELEPMSPSRYRLLAKAGRLQKKIPSELESESDNYNSKFNYSLSGIGEMYDNYGNQMSDTRACSSTDKKGSTLNLGALDSLVISAISSLSLKIRHSVCDVLVEHAKKLPVENETRLIVEEILPQLTADSSSSKSPTSIEEIDQSLYFDLAKTLKNLKKVEQMVDVIALISNQLPSQTSASFKTSSNQGTGNVSRISGYGDSTNTSDVNSNDTSPV